MNCPECKLIEMRVDAVTDNTMHFKCKKCGKEIIKTVEEIEEETKSE